MNHRQTLGRPSTIQPTTLSLSLLGKVLGVFLGHLFKFLGFFGQLLRNVVLQRMIRGRRLEHAVNGHETVFGIERGSPFTENGAANFSRFQHDGRVVDLCVLCSCCVMVMVRIFCQETNEWQGCNGVKPKMCVCGMHAGRTITHTYGCSIPTQSSNVPLFQRSTVQRMEQRRTRRGG